ncbi:hypothetical protein CJ030_MR2G028942 [Morella rubra]|uniref:Reverse transcriptase zinc-binding domain-containing protein n=1 Tax=Morella rubra TaxID=262757 RepID=A0A6A1WHL8_9ROSI|nr:hypothetical protein CJ030_MR2G028942 [Morella rubra]
MVNSLFISSTHFWNAGLVRDLFEEADADWILNCCSPSGSIEDKQIWTPASKGTFSLKSTYKLLSSPVSQTVFPIPAEDWKKLWAMPLQDRLKLLLWKIAWNALPCKINTCWSASPTEQELSCSLCHNAPETLEHLFFGCQIACMAWMESPSSLNFQDLPSCNIGEWIHLILHAGPLLHLPLREHPHFILFAAILFDSL